MYIFLGAFNQFTFGSKTSRKMFEKLLVLICLLTLSSANNLTFPSEDRQSNVVGNHSFPQFFGIV